MARSAANDRQYLEQHRGKWRVTVAVPRDLHHKLGSRLKYALNTDSLVLANRMKWPVINEMRATIADAQGGDMSLRAVAEEFRRQLAAAATDQEHEKISYAIDVTVDDIMGPETGVEIDYHTGEEGPAYDPKRLQKVAEFNKVLDGKATPLDKLHDQYMAQLTVKPRTKGDDRRAKELLLRWCREREVGPYIQSFATKRAAVAFIDDLPKLEPGLSPVTLNKYLRRLSRYWQWLEKREEVESDVWAGQLLPVPQKDHDEEERPFTEDEMVRLLTGPASQGLQDVMRIAALTGCRLDPIVCLRVRDCQDGVFVFKPQKKERVQRLCPIHSHLMEIVERRTKGKQPDDPLFPEWPGPQNSTSMRERSFKTSNEFTEYRRSVDVADERQGVRRSLVNFHSFRRWFITEAERADQPESLIAAVVGHKRAGITLGVYSAGPLIEQARRCVEAVRLPEKAR